MASNNVITDIESKNKATSHLFLFCLKMKLLLIAELLILRRFAFACSLPQPRQSTVKDKHALFERP